MKENVPSHCHGFLVEFILVILFFSIALAIILRVFAGAHMIRQKANDMTIASAKIQNLAEYTKNSDSKNEYIAILQNQGAVKRKEELDQYILYYNKNWEFQEEDTGYVYSIEINSESQDLKSGELLQVTIRSMKREREKMRQEYTEDAEEICAVKVGKYYSHSGD